MAKEEIKANDARLRTQVKEAWKDFKKRNPKEFPVGYKLGKKSIL